MQLIICSKSTEKYIDEFEYDEKLLVTEPPTKETLRQKDKYHDVIAIGGGAVIDSGKILSMNSIIAIPTTYSGASETSHAVYWDKGKKYDIKTKKPITVIKRRWIKLPKEVEIASKADCLSHIIESLVSTKSTKESDIFCNQAISSIKENKWLEASLYAGRAIEIAGTNIIHGLSYGLTGKHKIPHGISLIHILNLAKDYRKVDELL